MSRSDVEGSRGPLLNSHTAGLFERVVEAHKTALSVTDDHALDAEELANVVEKFKGVTRRETGEGFPQDPSTPGRTDNSAITCALWRPTTATYATSSSQSSEDVCGFCRRGWASAPPRLLSGSRELDEAGTITSDDALAPWVQCRSPPPR